MEAMVAAQQAVMEHQASAIEEAARFITQSVQRDGVLHMFGSGHSHLPAEEAFYRSGGLAAVSPLLDPSLMFHEGCAGYMGHPFSKSALERRSCCCQTGSF